MIRTGILLALTLAARAASAAEPFAAPQAAEPIAAPGAGSLVQVTLSLLLVLAAVFAAAWVMRRLRGFGRFAPGAIEIVADVALGTKERAVLIQVGKQQVLLGVAPGRVNTLHVLSEPVAAARGPHPGPPPATGGGDANASTSVYPTPGNAVSSSFPPPVAGGGLGGGARPDFKAILKRSLGL
jgi:flagellar protein FliO/FliZ